MFKWKILVPPIGSKSFAAKVFHGWKLESNKLIQDTQFQLFHFTFFVNILQATFLKDAYQRNLLNFWSLSSNNKIFFNLLISLTTSPGMYCADDAYTNVEKIKDLKI